MNRQSRLLLIFSLAFAALLISPPAYLRFTLPFYPLMELADATDILTPLILIPLYWLLLHNGDSTPARLPMVVFLLFTAFWVQGQGMHLAANSIGHLLSNIEQSDAYDLTNFYDETLSHYLWHMGVVGLSAVLVWRNWQTSVDMRGPDMVAVGLGGIVYGVTFFIITVEGVTVAIGLPFSIILIATIAVRARSRILLQPALMFFTIAYGLSLILYTIWGLMWGGFPEFSEIGIID